MMRLFSLQNFALRFNGFPWFGRKPRDTATATATPTTGAMAKVDTQRFLIHPQCLRLKQADLSYLAQAPNNTLYELLQLVSANKVASAEIAAIDMDILLAFIEAFYKGMSIAQICATATPTTPTEAALANLLALLDARKCINAQLTGNVAAFHDAWQRMRLSESDNAPMPGQAYNHAEE